MNTAPVISAAPATTRAARPVGLSMKSARPGGKARLQGACPRIQEVSEWERLVNSLVGEGRTDLYITGSNSRLLSGELAT